MRIVLLALVLSVSSAASAKVYETRCDVVSNEMAKYGARALAARLMICENARTKDCITLVTSDAATVAQQKAFTENLYFTFTQDHIDDILKQKGWSEETAYLEYGFTIDGEYRADGATLLKGFLAHSLKSIPFNSNTKVDKNKGLITTKSCQIDRTHG